MEEEESPKRGDETPSSPKSKKKFFGFGNVTPSPFIPLPTSKDPKLICFYITGFGEEEAASTPAAPSIAHTASPKASITVSDSEYRTRKGFLKKQGHKNTAYRVRWFILNRAVLSYYKDAFDNKPQGVINLSHGTVLKQFQEDATQLTLITDEAEQYKQYVLAVR
jgi:hypothetical protein